MKGTALVNGLLAMCVALIAACSDEGTSATIGDDRSELETASVIHTDKGDVRARSVSQGILLFRDVPYAAPPVGSLRWKPPAPREAWSGVFTPPSFTRGIACYSTIPKELEDLFGDRGANQSEDCLYLDVYAPAVRSSSPLPVVFFLHGGFGLWGSKGDISGTDLAKFGNVVVVSANYRLGPFGYLAHPALTAEQGSSGNYAHLDQIAALRWVKDNIAQFGGDPTRVTLSGQSWGGQSTCVLTASPLANGLFARAFDISGAGCLTWDQPTAYAGGETLARSLGCATASDVPACLRAARPDPTTKALPIHLWSLDYRWRAVVDGNVLPDKAQALIKAGAHNHMPFMIGTTSKEAGNMLTALFPPGPDDVAPSFLNPAAYEEALTTVYKEKAPQVLAHYPVSSFAAGDGHSASTEALIAVLTDERFTCPTRRVARAVASHQTEPVYRYVFDLTGRLRNEFGNEHGNDLPFVFHSAHSDVASSSSLLPAIQRTEDAVAGSVSRFAATGNPNGEGAPAWSAYDGVTDNVLRFDDRPRASAGVRTAECDFWDTLTSNP